MNHEEPCYIEGITYLSAFIFTYVSNETEPSLFSED